MTALIRCSSVRLLLQREEQPAALAALREHLRECPGDLDTGGAALPDDLVAALRLGDWVPTVDAYGDIVALRYGADKAPPDSSGDFPFFLLQSLAPTIRHGVFVRWEEQVDEPAVLTVGRAGTLHHDTVAPGDVPAPQDAGADLDDTRPAVVATYSHLDDEERIELGMPLLDAIALVDLPAAHEALRRYAVRHADEPGGEFLHDVLAAPDLRSALRAAALDIEPTESGVAGFRFLGDRLPGSQRQLWGLFAALEGTVTGDGSGFHVALADDPEHWVAFTYYWLRHSRDWTEPVRRRVVR